MNDQTPPEGMPKAIHWQVPEGCNHPADEACFYCATDDQILFALGPALFGDSEDGDNR